MYTPISDGDSDDVPIDVEELDYVHRRALDHEILEQTACDLLAIDEERKLADLPSYTAEMFARIAVILQGLQAEIKLTRLLELFSETTQEDYSVQINILYIVSLFMNLPSLCSSDDGDEIFTALSSFDLTQAANDTVANGICQITTFLDSATDTSTPESESESSCDSQPN